ncbi:MAG: UDP-N-acetylmuramate dehydrogenase [Erysipelotrichaceae bacterium]|nr:UDP-N-acetylmuramate dehydrogenase [Erysipelotrichaceae bacterium]MCI9313104.1 UDP-N-acetylmuramate dehydrogenase [Erysipelotrichaceae bacterium]
MELEQQLAAYGDVERNESLAKHTTFRIGGSCAYLVYPKNQIALMRILEIAKQANMPCKLLGKGSNLLCSDEVYPGIVLCLDRYMNEFYFEEDGTCVAQAGCSIILLAHEAMKRSLSGLEFACGIPGTLGGAIFMNAGAYKASISDLLHSVLVLRNGDCTWMDVADLAYGYRTSRFQQERDWIIVGAKLKLIEGDQNEIRELMDSRRKRRMATQPLDQPSAGSMFRNPESAFAWELIDQIGYRGKRIGGAMVSEKHPNFIVNADHASAADVAALVCEIQQKVKERFKIELRTEVERFNWKN